MNHLKNLKLYTLSKVLFAEGWFFFVPYVFFYLVFKSLHLKISYLENIFILLHFLNSLLLVYYFYKVYQNNNHLSKVIFWLCLILLFLIPGAYIEFPSDAWEHFRRIFEWQACLFIDDHSTNYKFTYFWGWTLMSKVGPLSRRTGLDIYSTFWQFLLAYQFYLFAKRIGFSESWAKVQVLGTICLFGINLFGFYRLYALSSTPLAYIAYLQSLIVIMDVFDGKTKKVILLIFLVPIIYYNHYQEILLLIISSTSIFMANIYEKKQPFLTKKIKYSIIITLILGFIGCSLTIHFFQSYTLLISQFWNSYLQNYFQEKTVLNWTLDSTYWSKWGILRIWDPKLPYFQVLGIYGCFSMLCSLIFWNKYRVLSTLTLFPLLLLFFQPFTLFIAAIDGQHTTFRVLYALPYSFMFIVALKEIFEFITQSITNKKYINSYLIIIFILIFLSWQPSQPWLGKLWHQLYKIPAQLSLKNIDITAQWFFDNRQLEGQYVNAQWFFDNPRLDSQCFWVSDNATSFSLATHLALIPPNRLFSYNPSITVNNFEVLKMYLQSPSKQKICGFLVGIPDQMQRPPISKTGQLSGYWFPDIVRQDLNYRKEFLEATAFLKSLGWTQTFVPPFYWLYELPKQ